MDYLEEVKRFGITLDDSEVKLISKNLPEYLFTKLMSQAISPDIEHLKICDCSKPYRKSAEKLAIKNNIELYKKRGMKERDDNNEIYNNYIQQAKDREMWKIILNQFKSKNITCSVEQKEIFKVLILFAKKYDFNDPRVFIIVDSLIHQMLSAHRMQLHSNQHGVLNVWYDKNDNKRLSINPVEALKLKYDEAKITSIATLDKIFEGNKIVSVNFRDEMIEAYKNRHNLKETEDN